MNGRRLNTQVAGRSSAQEHPLEQHWAVEHARVAGDYIDRDLPLLVRSIDTDVRHGASISIGGFDCLERVQADEELTFQSGQMGKEPLTMPTAAYEYVAFVSQSTEALARLTLLLDVVKQGKHGPHDRLIVEAEAHLMVEDRARFWWPTPEEQGAYMEDWWATPLPERHQSPYLRTPWQFASALIATCDCDYNLVDVVEVGTQHHARFQTLGYPYGGPASLVELIEGLGHHVTGTDDGTGYKDYVPEARLWKSKRHSNE